jgi:hypothetical protein
MNLKKLLLNKKCDYFKLLIIDIYKSFQEKEIQKRLVIGKEAISPNRITEIMLFISTLLENNKIVEAHQVFYKCLIYSKSFDFSLILYFRYLLYIYIKKNENKLYSETFPVILGNLLPSKYENNGVFDYESFYQTYLLEMNIPAEKIIIYVTPYVLGINLDVVLFNDEEDQIIKHFNFVGDDVLQIKEKIFIINKKGHYEIVFNYYDNRNFNYVYRFYRNDLKNCIIKVDPFLDKIYQKIKNLGDNQNQTTPTEHKDTNIKMTSLKNTKINSDNNMEENYGGRTTPIINPKDKNPNKTDLDEALQTKIIHNNPPKCDHCNSTTNEQRKIIKNICHKCIFNEAINQSKEYYGNYLKSMLQKINKVTVNDLHECFLNKICVNIDNNKYSINQIAEEYLYNTNININQFLDDLVKIVKERICLMCYKNTNNIAQFRLPCGCNFCCKEHVNNFFRNIVKNHITYNYKCLCSYEYKPNETYQLCTFLYNNQIYGSDKNFINHLQQIFSNICCKCAYSRQNLTLISVNEDFMHNFYHKICDNCKKYYSSNKCIICDKNHQYISLEI